ELTTSTFSFVLVSVRITSDVLCIALSATCASNSATCASNSVLLACLTLSTLPNPTSVLVVPALICDTVKPSKVSALAASNGTHCVPFQYFIFGIYHTPVSTQSWFNAGLGGAI